MSRARIVVHNSRMHFVRLCSGFELLTNADIPARVRLTGVSLAYPLTPSERTTEGALFIGWVFPAGHVRDVCCVSLVGWYLGKLLHALHGHGLTVIVQVSEVVQQLGFCCTEIFVFFTRLHMPPLSSIH